MSKFCGQCGAEVNEGMVFCASCGARIEVQTPPPQPQTTYIPPQPNPSYVPPVPPAGSNPGFIPPTPPKKKRVSALAIILTSVVLVAAVVGVLFLTGVLGGNDDTTNKNTPEGIVKTYMEAVIDRDAEKAVDCYPSFLWGNDPERKEIYINSFNESIEEDGFSSYKILSVKEMSKSQIDAYEELFDWIQLSQGGMYSADITDYKLVEVEASSRKGNSEIVTQIEFHVIKYKGEWLLFDSVFE